MKGQTLLLSFTALFASAYHGPLSGSYDLRIYNPSYIAFGPLEPVIGQWLTKTGVSGTAVVSGAGGTTTLEIGPDLLGTFVPDVGPALTEFEDVSSGTQYALCFAGVTLDNQFECAETVYFQAASNAPSAANVGICSVEDTAEPCEEPEQAADALRVHFDKIDWGEENPDFYYIVELSTGECMPICSRCLPT